MKRREKYEKKHVCSWKIRSTSTTWRVPTTVSFGWGFSSPVPEPEPVHEVQRECEDCGKRQRAKYDDVLAQQLPQSLIHLADVPWTDL